MSPTNSSKEIYPIYASLPLNLAISQNRGESIRYNAAIRRQSYCKDSTRGKVDLKHLISIQFQPFLLEYLECQIQRFGRYFTSTGEIKVISPWWRNSCSVYLTLPLLYHPPPRVPHNGLLPHSSYAPSLCARVISGWSHHGVGTLQRETHNSV